MSDSLTFVAVVPGQPPSVNHTHRNAYKTLPDGRSQRFRVKTQEATAYIQNVWGSVLEARPRGWRAPEYQPETGEGFVFVDIYLYLAREVDADNTAKCLMDGIKHALGIDDKQLLPRYQGKQIGVKEPRVELWIT